MNYWFRSKEYGWGWRPSTWQGWLSIMVWIVTNALGLFFITSTSSPVHIAYGLYIIFFIASTVLLFLISWAKGERPAWRWEGQVVPAHVVSRKIFVWLEYILVAQTVGVIGSLFTFDSITTWYALLEKPDFAPPNWLFGPVWVILYALMGTAAFFAWDRRHTKTHASRALSWYWFQLILNALWTPIFFGLHNIGLALVIIIALWFSIILMIREFAFFSRKLSLLLVPYLAWVSFATLLNYSLWILN